MEKIVEAGLLLDTYGNVLSKKQYELLYMHYIDDFSLTEISENENMTRQGVHDNIKRGFLHLQELEDKLNVIKRNEQMLIVFDKIINLTKEINIDGNDHIKEKCLKINKIIKDFIDKEG